MIWLIQDISLIDVYWIDSRININLIVKYGCVSTPFILISVNPN